MSKKITSWIFSVLTALILLQTLFFKFTGSEESVAIFSKLGVEPWGRVLTGVLELVASVCILVPVTRVLGALMAAGLMLGAIAAHVLVIGIESQGDGGYLFLLALIVLLSSIVVILTHKTDVKKLFNFFLGKNR